MFEKDIKDIPLKLNKLLLEYENKIKILNSKEPNYRIFNDFYHELKELVSKIYSLLKSLEINKKQIKKKLASKEFQFISKNFNIKQEELNPEFNNFNSYEEFLEFLEIKGYHAYSWDSFLFPWKDYYENLEQLNFLIKEIKNKIKLTNFYLKQHDIKEIKFSL